MSAADTPLLTRLASQTPDGSTTTLEALLSTYPLRRIATAQEIGEAAVWVCTKATFMTGHTVLLDGGATCT
jgi:NAD(P)-dependent dehydrogenase (short-subunit alcohol dehydrogenase family)